MSRSRHPHALGLVLSALAACLFTGASSHLAAERQATERSTPNPFTAVADIEAGRQTTPVMGDALPNGDVPVLFLAQSSRGRAPRIVSDVTGWGERPDGRFDAGTGAMARVGRTTWFALRTIVAPRARIEYALAYSVGDNELDPHNPRHVGPPPASEFVTAGYVPPPALVDPPVSTRGTLREVSIDSRALGNARRAVVYVPPGESSDRRPLVVFLDSRATEMARVIDWLIAHGRVEPFVGAFVGVEPPGDGAPSPAALRTFLSEELPARLSAMLNCTEQAAERGIVAISFAAKDALETTIQASMGYGRLGLLIPGRRITAADIDAVRTARREPVRVSILGGRYDLANVATARRLQRALRDAGHDVHYAEVPEGHSPRTWLNHLDTVLTDLLPPRPVTSTASTGEESTIREVPVTDADLRRQDEDLRRRFDAARAACDDRWTTDESCQSTLKRLRSDELRLFATARAHQFTDLTESNYWHRGRLKFPSEIAQLSERLGIQ